ncbi:MAG: 16S rRNA (uracil(1498)-N(3))-methyltransferase [Pseudomonadota bacterium]
MPPRIDFTSQRLFVDGALSEGAVLQLTNAQAHYLLTVLRMETGAGLLAFNGRDGEWRVEVERQSKRAGTLHVLEQTRPQAPANNLWFLFAPIKKDRLGWMVEKAVEMGVGHIAPVITDYTQSPKLRMDKLQAHGVEAAEQCGVLAVPSFGEPQPLDAVLAAWPEDRALIFCDEQAEVADPAQALEGLRGQPLAVLIGPEGGFSQSERDQLCNLSSICTIALGPRILRTDTAAVAALSAVQMAAGDWAS